MKSTKRSPIQWLGVTLKGIAMGAADVVPGVSGGTIAFITGIYEELISSLDALSLSSLKVLRKEGVKAFWKKVNGNFFVALLFGVGISVFSLAKLVTHLLMNYPVLIWSFFFGLIIASFIIVFKTVKEYNFKTLFALVIGTVIAGAISVMETTGEASSNWFLVLSGAIAICAMILPGISGAFILVLLGSYNQIISGIKEFDVTVIGLFGVGCVLGLLSFSKLLKYMFMHFKAVVLALLSGFLLGSLLKVWPWKNKVGDVPIIVHSDGREDFMMTNVLPTAFEGEAQLLYSILIGVGGLVFVLILERFSPKDEQ